MTTQNLWGKQLRAFRLHGGYESQGAWVNAASTLTSSLSPSQFNELQSAIGLDESAFEISQTMLSRWETGARKPPRERNRHVCIIWMLAQLGCVESRSHADEWLAMADLKPLTPQECLQVWPDLDSGAKAVGTQRSRNNPKASQHSSQTERSSVQIIDWGEAPRVDFFYGRAKEQQQLMRWLTQDKCQVIGIWGMGGQGKTTLAAKICREVVDDVESEVAGEFDGIIWRSLLNAPPLDELLGHWIQTLSDKRLFELPTKLNERLLLLFELLSQKRYLLVLDNVESILQADDSLGRYRTGYELYGQLILRFGETAHKSCLLLTSREEPREFTRLRSLDSNSTNKTSQTLRLEGLDLEASQALMLDDIVQGTPASIKELGRRYSGHPLALMLVSRSIAEFYGGDIDLFLEQEPDLFSDIQELLTGHVSRITESELSILYWLAIEREPTSTQTLRENVVLSTEQSQLMASLRSLQRRSLIENHPDPNTRLARFTLQNVVTEFLTERILQEAISDLLSEELDSEKWWGQSFLHFHALIKVTGKSYIRKSQERLLLRPVAETLLNRLGGKRLREVLVKRLTTLQDSGITVGYTAGNILNLLLYLGEDLAGLDFSHLPVWQAGLDAQQLQHINFRQSDLSGSVFHENFVRIISIAFHPDNSTIFAGTTQGQLEAYDMASLQAVEKHSGPIQHIYALEVSNNGKVLLSSGVDGIVYIWDIIAQDGEKQTGAQGAVRGKYKLKLRYQFEESERPRSAAFCIDDTIIALGCADKIRLRDANTGKLLATLDGHVKAVHQLIYVPTKGMLVSAGWNNRVFVWQLDPLETEPIATVPTLPSDFACVDISPDGEFMAIACHDGQIYLSRLSDFIANVDNQFSPLSTLIGHTGKINQVSFSPAEWLLASCGVDRTVRIWDLDSGHTQHLLSGHRDEIDALKFSPDGSYLVSSGSDRTLRLWDPKAGEEVRTLGSYADGSSSAVDFSPDGRLLVSGSDDGTVRVWDLSTYRCIHALMEQTNHIFDVAWNPSSTAFASASLDQTICIWDTGTGQLLHTLTDHRGEVTSVMYHPTQPLLVSSSNDRTIRLWDVSTGIEQHAWVCAGGAVWCVQFSPDGRSVAAGSTSGVLYIWDLESKQLVQELIHHEDLVWSVAYSPDGRYIASAGYEGEICLWDLQQGSVIKQWTHGAVVRTIAFSPDSRHLISVGDNQKICLWNIENDQECYSSFGQYVGAISSDGQLIAVGADHWSIHLLQAKSGELTKRLDIEGPFHGTNITNVRGISSVQIETLKSMGAIEER